MTNDHSLRPDDFTFAIILAACAGLTSIGRGKRIHTHLIRVRFNQDAGVGNALVNMYARCGLISYEDKVFNNMLHHNLVLWNTIIAAYRNHGRGGVALKLFEQMKDEGVKPDLLKFIGLLMACNHAGLVEEGKVFNSVEETYGIALDIEFFSCLIDLLGWAGKLLEAAEYLKKFPFGQDPIILGTLLSACQLHGDVVIGERLAKQLLNLQPVTASPHVLLSNLCALDSMWRDVGAWL